MIRHTFFLLALALLAGNAWAQREVDETRDMRPDGRLSFEAVVGQFEIIGSPDDRLHITGTLGEEVREMRIQGDAGHWSVKLETHRDEDRRMRRGNGTVLTIALPGGADLESRTVSGDQTVSNLDGREVRIASVSGRIDLSGVTPERLEVETVSGAQNLDSGGRSESRLQSVSGNLSATGLAGRVKAKSVSGSIDLEVQRLDSMDVETVSGRVRVGAQPTSGSRIELSSHSGSLQLAVPADTAMEVRAQTFSGRIASELGGDVVRGRGPGRSMEHRTGNGNVRIELRSFSGNIELVGSD
jgi:DUF4097 and DUF4098 domain-containing protein YvlB